MTGRPLHVVVAYNERAEFRIGVTTYEPDPAVWEDNFKTRRTQWSVWSAGTVKRSRALLPSPWNGGGCTVIFKGVPADVCDNCGECYLSERISAELLELAEQAARKGTEVEIIRDAA